jgi:ATP-dependent RNA helicase HrpB
VRFDRKWRQTSRIVVVTEGTLVRMLQSDSFLEDVGAVVFDEFHERSLDTDLSLAMTRRVQETVRPDLKLVVMSATLSAEAVSQYLGCPVVSSEGRLHSVKIEYLPRVESTPWPVATARTVERLLTRTSGDVLVFLPGLREIRETARELEPLAREREFAVMLLHGDLPAEQQDAALSKQSRRKVVLSTNVAETSVTVEGVTAVIDTGLVRQLKFDPNAGLDRLELTPISRASAEQRAGRAGRTQPGVCVRLWSEASQRARPEQTEPEIRRVDLAGPVLQLLSWGESDVFSLPWFEPPREASVQHAEELLRRLGAIDSDRRVTELGQRLAELPVHPRLGRLLIEGERLGCLERTTMAAALLAERDPFERVTGVGRSSHQYSRSDVLDRVEALEAFEARGEVDSTIGRLQRAGAQTVLRVRDQLLRLVCEEHAPRTPLGPPFGRGGKETAVLQAVLAAFPDRLAKRREANSPRGVMVGGRGVRLDGRSTVTRDELFVCLDVDDSASEAVVRLASAVERDWLLADQVTIAIEVSFDATNERVQARRQVRWDDLVLEESPAALPVDDSVANLLAQAAVAKWERVRLTDDSPAGRYLTRVRWLRGVVPELELPAFDDAQLQELLPSLIADTATRTGATCRSFAELREAPWLETIQNALTVPQRQAVEREAPERIVVPSGSRIVLQYEVGRPPVLAVRIQEVFGLRATPRVAHSRVSVLLHLLAPSHRPQQITDDLASFWSNAYPKIKSELRRRYPKHAWPDDPLTATPERRPGRGGRQ